MKLRTTSLSLMIMFSIAAYAGTTTKGVPVTTHAKGTFDVKVTPQGDPDQAEGSTLGRMALDKQFHGDLEGTGKGQMLTAGSESGSAVYVAIERVTCTLQGKKGSFVLVHRGAMTKESQELIITVMPDSGSGELKGIAGKLAIEITGGKHFYDFEYTLPE
jgi:hypothetical protein